jgi:hypothetical protein
MIKTVIELRTKKEFTTIISRQFAIRQWLAEEYKTYHLRFSLEKLLSAEGIKYQGFLNRTSLQRTDQLLTTKQTVKDYIEEWKSDPDFTDEHAQYVEAQLRNFERSTELLNTNNASFYSVAECRVILDEQKKLGYLYT